MADILEVLRRQCLAKLYRAIRLAVINIRVLGAAGDKKAHTRHKENGRIDSIHRKCAAFRFAETDFKNGSIRLDKAKTGRSLK